MKPLFIFLLILAVILIGNTFAYAQGLPGLPDAPQQAPIDGGLGLLAAAGGAYAYKKLKKSREN